MGTPSLSDDLRRFIAAERWTFAKTMPDWPREYLARGKVDERLVEHIRAKGCIDRFRSRAITDFDFEGFTSWTMGAPIEETTIVNRCRKEDTFEGRSAARRRGASPSRARRRYPATKDKG
jgi:hypothetical protein